jgi:hypothetical protein
MRTRRFTAISLEALVCVACSTAGPKDADIVVGEALTSDPSTYFINSDLVWHNATTAQVAYWQVEGSATINGIAATTAGAPWQLKATGDFNKDGATDFAWQNGQTSEIGLWLADPTDKSQQRFDGRGIGTPVGWDLATAGDLDSDGNDDLFFRNTTTGANAVWYMHGFAVEGAYLPPVPDLSWHLKGISDLDGNGSPELVWRNDNGSNVGWQMNPSARRSILGSWPITAVGGGWDIAAVDDVDSDGKSDLLWRNASSGQTALWLMNGASIAKSAFISPNVTDPAWKLVGTRIPGGDASPAATTCNGGVDACDLLRCEGGYMRSWAAPAGDFTGSCTCVCDDPAIDKSKSDRGGKKRSETECTKEAKRIGGNLGAPGACNWITSDAGKAFGCKAKDEKAMKCNWSREQRYQVSANQAVLGGEVAVGNKVKPLVSGSLAAMADCVRWSCRKALLRPSALRIARTWRPLTPEVRRSAR